MLLQPRRNRRFIKPAVVAPPAGLSSFTFVDQTANIGSGGSAGLPGTPVEGDFGVIVWSSQNSSGSPADANPTGWTICIDGASGSVRVKMWAKIFSASETDPASPTPDGTSFDDGNVAVFRPNVPIASFAWNGPALFLGNGAPGTMNGLQGSAIGVPIIAYHAMRASVAITGHTPPAPAMTELGPVTGDTLKAWYKIYNSGDTPANHTGSMPDLGNANGQWAGYFSFTAA